jgi:hypothetical protein
MIGVEMSVQKLLVRRIESLAAVAALLADQVNNFVVFGNLVGVGKTLSAL